MSVHIRPRQLGAIIECNRCVARLATAQIEVRAIRAYASTRGWIRGLRKHGTATETANTRHDICLACAPAERAEEDARCRAAAERVAIRDANRKTPDQRRVRRNELARKRRAEKSAQKAARAARVAKIARAAGVTA